MPELIGANSICDATGGGGGDDVICRANTFKYRIHSEGEIIKPKTRKTAIKVRFVSIIILIIFIYENLRILEEKEKIVDAVV